MSCGWVGTVKFVLIRCIIYLFSLQVYVIENNITIKKYCPQGLRNKQNNTFSDNIAMIAKKNIIDNIA